MQSSHDIDMYKNTSLHQAILMNQTERALQLIESEPSLINVAVLENTPLLLAIKTGNVDIALALLQHPHIDVNVADNTGMRAIHWAAFLRMDVLIKLLLPTSLSTIAENKKAFGKLTAFASLLPSDFYKTSFLDIARLDVENFGFMEGSFLATNLLLLQMGISMFSQRAQERAKEKLRTDLAHTALTNLSYHMDSLCINYCGMERKELMRSYNASQDNLTRQYKSSYPRSSDIYRYNFVTGYPVLAIYRNSLALDADLLSALEESEKGALLYNAEEGKKDPSTYNKVI